MSLEIEFDQINDLISYKIALASTVFREKYLDLIIERGSRSHEDVLDLLGLFLCKTVREIFLAAIEFAEKSSEKIDEKLEVTYKIEVDLKE